MRILIFFFALAFVACSHGPKVSERFKHVRQKREIATTGIVSWAQDILVETTASNEEATAVKLENLKRDLDYVEKYSVMFINTSDIDAFQETLFVTNPFLKKYNSIWVFASDETKAQYADKFFWILDKALEQVDKAAFHMKINDINFDPRLSGELLRVSDKFSMAYKRLEPEHPFETRYLNLNHATKLAEVEIKKRKSWFSW